MVSSFRKLFKNESKAGQKDLRKNDAEHDFEKVNSLKLYKSGVTPGKMLTGDELINEMCRTMYSPLPQV